MENSEDIDLRDYICINISATDSFCSLHFALQFSKNKGWERKGEDGRRQTEKGALILANN